MAAINRSDFDSASALPSRRAYSFIVQGAGISRDVVSAAARRDVPFAGIVSSGRLALMYEKWGADLLVAEGAEAGGRIGDIGHPLPALLAEVLTPLAARHRRGRHRRGDLPGIFAAGAPAAARDALPRLPRRRRAPELQADASRQGRGRRHPHHELREGYERAGGAQHVHRGPGRWQAAFPPQSKAWFFGKEGYLRAPEGLHRVPRDGRVPVPRQRLPEASASPTRSSPPPSRATWRTASSTRARAWRPLSGMNRRRRSRACGRSSTCSRRRSSPPASRTEAAGAGAPG